MRKSALLFICLILSVGGFCLYRPSQCNRLHDEWLQERYFEAISIKEGMTRADLIKLFHVDSGFQSVLPNRYVLKSAGLIKVDVEFDMPESAKGKMIPDDLHYDKEILAKENYQSVPNEKLKIKSISRPYIKQFSND